MPEQTADQFVSGGFYLTGVDIHCSKCKKKLEAGQSDNNFTVTRKRDQIDQRQPTQPDPHVERRMLLQSIQCFIHLCICCQSRPDPHVERYMQLQTIHHGNHSSTKPKAQRKHRLKKKNITDGWLNKILLVMLNIFVILPTCFTASLTGCLSPHYIIHENGLCCGVTSCEIDFEVLVCEQNYGNDTCSRCKEGSFLLDATTSETVTPCVSPLCVKNVTIVSKVKSTTINPRACPQWCKCDLKYQYCGTDPCNCEKKTCSYGSILQQDCGCRPITPSPPKTTPKDIIPVTTRKSVTYEINTPVNSSALSGYTTTPVTVTSGVLITTESPDNQSSGVVIAVIVIIVIVIIVIFSIIGIVIFVVRRKKKKMKKKNKKENKPVPKGRASDAAERYRVEGGVYIKKAGNVSFSNGSAVRQKDSKSSFEDESINEVTPLMHQGADTTRCNSDIEEGTPVRSGNTDENEDNCTSGSNVEEDAYHQTNTKTVLTNDSADAKSKQQAGVQRRDEVTPTKTFKGFF
ncbi:uncharacterized protein LOC132547064 [Ylistrum balloti]|uniref:uncharacterized protein LOC132547064 n=1 Tax=Ylistrum balloti TaxID=509963 RepID=UPI002905B6CB|nr:uncharacterized protein LOC132547064 [Ylistrum balloti]XP_060066800.1 uncharacterized protein LOC132547064 [Ylistrum balloti]